MPYAILLSGGQGSVAALFVDESLNIAQDRLFDIERIAQEGLEEIEK